MLDLFELRDLCHANTLIVTIEGGTVKIKAARVNGESLTRILSEPALHAQLTTAAESTEMNELDVLEQIMSEMTR